ncbi:hypothetical protein DSO57_1033625 [Entomophthora muscae]|uniref:Uncharacterized protein n=1 Tax=Entomophthora muscae TaxID=34485 RepID=A0ACC2SZZ5_9FUNG|nr:hypothetical protein DSO57_1033625 [Entomophthora muscae]
MERYAFSIRDGIRSLIFDILPNLGLGQAQPSPQTSSLRVLGNQQESFSLTHPMHLGLSSRWTSPSHQFTEAHILPIEDTGRDLCYCLNNTSICETEVQRNYFLPESVNPSFISVYKREETLADVTVPLPDYPTIYINQVKHSLSDILQDCKATSRRNATFTLVNLRHVAIKFKPVLLAVTVSRNQSTRFTYHFLIALEGGEVDGIFLDF